MPSPCTHFLPLFAGLWTRPKVAPVQVGQQNQTTPKLWWYHQHSEPDLLWWRCRHSPGRSNKTMRCVNTYNFYRKKKIVKNQHPKQYKFCLSNWLCFLLGLCVRPCGRSPHSGWDSCSWPPGSAAWHPVLWLPQRWPPSSDTPHS